MGTILLSLQTKNATGTGRRTILVPIEREKKTWAQRRNGMLAIIEEDYND